MYSCNDCSASFEQPNEGACPICGSGDIFDEETVENTAEEKTIEEVVAEADEKNKKGFASSLRAFGEDYIRYKNNAELAKRCIKSLLEDAKDKGITKDMLLAYASAVQLEDFNAKVLCSAVQQELGLESEEINEEELENKENEAENNAEGIGEEEESDEKSNNQGNE